MKEKKAEEAVGTTLYSHVDDSQSSRNMSQFLASDTQVSSKLFNTKYRKKIELSSSLPC